MRRTRKSSVLSLVYRPLCIAFLLFSVFGLVWLRSSVTSAAYALRELEDKRTREIKEMKTLLAERAGLMALSTLEYPEQAGSRTERKLVSGGFAFPDRLKVIHVQRSKGPDVRRAAYQPGEGR
jgi:hypothetical protein